MGLGDQRERVLADAVDQPQLPQRLGAVERLGEDPPGQVAQLLLAGRRGQRGVAHVVAGVEMRVVDPDRPALHQRREGELLAVARDEVQPLLELGHELVIGRRVALEHEHGADVHVGAAALQREEGRVEAAQAVGVGHAPDSPRFAEPDPARAREALHGRWVTFLPCICVISPTCARGSAARVERQFGHAEPRAHDVLAGG